MSSANEWTTRAEEVARDVLARHADEVDRTARWPAESVAALGRTGLLGLTVPAPSGGAGQGPRTFAAVTRNLARQCASTAMIYLMHVCGTQLLAGARTLSNSDQLLSDIAAGRHLSTLAFSEKGSRSHFWAPVSQAVVNGDEYVLTADKSWVTSAGYADSYLVSTRSGEQAGPMALTVYRVSKDTPGFRTNGSWNGLGLRGNASAPMRLDGVRLSTADRVGVEGAGFALMMEVVLPWFQLGSAAVSLGIAEAAVEATRNHMLSSQLEHLGQPLASLPNLRSRLAEMQVSVDMLAAFLDQVAGRMESPGPETLLAVLQSKAAAAETALRVTDLAMRNCGGAAFSRHLGIERNFRDARAGWVMAPTTDVLYDFIGKAVLGMPLF